jgi:hypothetical protein
MKHVLTSQRQILERGYVRKLFRREYLGLSERNNKKKHGENNTVTEYDHSLGNVSVNTA